MMNDRNTFRSQLPETLEAWIISALCLSLSTYITVTQWGASLRYYMLAEVFSIELPSTSIGWIPFNVLFWVAMVQDYNNIGYAGLWATMLVYAAVCSVIGIVKRDVIFSFRLPLPSVLIAFLMATFATGCYLQNTGYSGRREALALSITIALFTFLSSVVGCIACFISVMLYELLNPTHEGRILSDLEIGEALLNKDSLNARYYTGPGFCPYCHVVYEKALPQVCNGCGWDLSLVGAPRVCSECDGEVYMSDRYCRRCGVTLEVK